jgi:hypothetical protein
LYIEEKKGLSDWRIVEANYLPLQEMMMNRILRFLVTISKEQKRQLIFHESIPALAREMAVILLEYSPTYESYLDKSTLKHRICQSLRPFNGFEYDLLPPKLFVVVGLDGGASLLEWIVIVLLFFNHLLSRKRFHG